LSILGCVGSDEFLKDRATDMVALAEALAFADGLDTVFHEDEIEISPSRRWHYLDPISILAEEIGAEIFKTIGIRKKMRNDGIDG
jgi:hypothetical protein